MNTLYITSDDAYVRKERETFIVEVNHEKVFQAPTHSIENIVCFGFKPLTPALMAYCAENSVGISYLSETGKFLARVYGAQQGNVLLRKAQYAMADDEFLSLAIARPIIAAKVSNYRSLLLRHQRNHPDHCSEEVVLAAETMGRRLTNIQQSENLDELRGYEGECATLYFGVLSSLITAQNEDFIFTKRT
ncbi:MAG: CRISPR-associated endonuclease Cas1, partial [Ignavibacteriaceae bacterium]